MRILGSLIVAMALLATSGQVYVAKDVGTFHNLALGFGYPAHAAPQNNLEQRLSELSKQISEGLTENQKQTIAVVEFDDLKGKVTDFGRFVAEKLTTRLFQTKKFKIIERQLLNKIVTEQKLSLTGIIEPSTAQRIGKLLGVDAIAAGTVSDLGKVVDVNARLINTETGEIFVVASVEIAKDDMVRALMTQAETAPNTSEPTGAPERKQSRTVESDFFTFELVKCALSGSTAVCDLLVTNHDVERQLKFMRSTLFDELGNAHAAGRTEIGNSGRIAVLVSGVATKVRVPFSDISTQVRGTPLVSFEFNVDRADARFGGGGHTFKIEFRNVLLKN